MVGGACGSLIVYPRDHPRGHPREKTEKGSLWKEDRLSCVVLPDRVE